MTKKAIRGPFDEYGRTMADIIQANGALLRDLCPHEPGTMAALDFWLGVAAGIGVTLKTGDNLATQRRRGQ